jgi:hypothetical protein
MGTAFRSSILAAAVIAAASSGLCAADPPPSARCALRLQVQLSPDVPDPRDPGFLSSLASNPGYTLTWVSASGFSVVLELAGPGTDYLCHDEVAQIRKDSRVLQLTVLPAGAAPQ